MSNLFAFNQAEDSSITIVPGGHYDADQQLWVADEVSRAYEEIAPVEGGATKEATGKVTGGPSGNDWEVDGKIDW